jgi:beta-barrel assembly-enhancing protease
MMETSARYFDGVRPVPHSVVLRRVSAGLEIVLPDDRAPVLWPFAEARIDTLAPEARLHRVHAGLDTGERLVLEGDAFGKTFGAVVGRFGRGRAGEASRTRVLFWCGAAVASLLFLYFFGLSAFARYAAPLVPWRWEAALGKNVEPQVLEIFAKGKPVQFCGSTGSPGKAALEAMVAKLVANAGLPGPLRVDVLDVAQTNAFALPGGRVFLFRPVIERAGDPDEIAGVLAHEIGHVIHRDSMRGLIHDGTLSLIIAAVLGDFTGGSTVAMLGNMMLGSAYSRENESEADRVSVDLMRRAGADPRAINRFFQRLATKEPGKRTIFDAFSSHPITAERIAEVEKLAAGSTPKAPILDPEQWSALKRICAEPRRPAPSVSSDVPGAEKL